MYTVKQLSNLAGVSVRTLHYYDEIGLLKPASVGQNGYRYYQDGDLFRLQQILFFREMDLGLLQIKEIVDHPDFDLVAALREHRHALQAKIDRMQTLIHTVDSTIMHLVGEIKRYFLFLLCSDFGAKRQNRSTINEKYRSAEG
jgi:MerR family transcriptional regulator, thiopeptide resistance regulator